MKFCTDMRYDRKKMTIEQTSSQLREREREREMEVGYVGFKGRQNFFAHSDGTMYTLGILTKIRI